MTATLVGGSANGVKDSGSSDFSDSVSVRIAFGSCSKPYLNQPLWKHISQRRIDLFAWTGDIVYVCLFYTL